MGDWFEELFGFREDGRHDTVHENMVVLQRAADEQQEEGRGVILHSRLNGRNFQCGTLECLSLKELRERALLLSAAAVSSAGEEPKKQYGSPLLRISELVGDARQLHMDPVNAGTTFQVASQFNLLEMMSPRNTPEQGITRYIDDCTQGPTCAIACAAGTVVRNYFVPVVLVKDAGASSSVNIPTTALGQTRHHQVDSLAEVGETLGNTNERLWKMENGYALASRSGLKEITDKLTSKYNEEEMDQLRSQLRIGVQWDTQVTLEGCTHLVTQAYCSALPVAYSRLEDALWQPFARLVLMASYEATFWTAVLNAERTGNKTVFLTLLGGGAFGNKEEWIMNAIEQNCKLFQDYDLNVKVVSFGHSSKKVREFCCHIEESIQNCTNS